MIKFSIKSERGVTMLLTLIILSFILATAMAAAGVVAFQIRLARDVTDSVAAIAAADAGAEWQLYNIRKGTTTEPIMVNGATFIIDVTYGSPTILESLGTYRTAKRKFRLAF